MSFKYVKFKTGIGNRFIIHLDHIVSVRSINSMPRSYIKILTDTGDERTVIEGTCLECNIVFDEYVDWISTLGEGSQSKCFDFTECLAKMKVDQIS